jgi:hypothetical protein
MSSISCVPGWQNEVYWFLLFLGVFTNLQKSDCIIMSGISSTHIEQFGSMEYVFVKLYAGDFY